MSSFDRPIEIIEAQRDDDEDVQAAFDEFREDLGKTETPGTIRVFRLPINEHNQPVATKTQTILFSAPIDQYKLDEVIARVQREFFLPGENFVAIRIAGYKQGVGGNAFNRIIMIQRGAPAPNPSGVATTPQQSELGSVLRAFQDANTQTQNMMREFFERLAQVNSRPAIDPAEQASKMVTMITGLAGVLTRQPVAAVAGPSASIKEMVETMVMLRDLSAQMGDGGKGDDNSMARIIEAVTPLAKPMLEVMAANKNAPGRAARPQPRIAGPQAIPDVVGQPIPGAVLRPSNTPLSSDAPTPPPIPTQETDAMLFAQLRPQFDTLAKMAGEGADPVQVAQMTMDQLPESADGPIYALLSDPNWLQKFVTINPVVNQHVEWFTKLRDALLAEFDTGDAANG